MMAEVIVVASIILLSLTGFYALYNKTISLYNDRISYYDAATLYELADYRNKNSINFTKTYPSYEKLKENNYEVIYLLRGDLSVTDSHMDLIDSKLISKTFIDYLNYLARSEEFYKDSHVLVMEKCADDKKNDCKYAYLETAVK